MSSKNKHLNIITHLLAYDSKTTTDNPIRRHVDWARRIFNIPVKEPVSTNVDLEPMDSKVVFDGTRSHGLDAIGSELSIELKSAKDSRYRISSNIADAFRTSRSVTALTNCDVSVNNNSVAVFDFDAADLSSVQVGDVMRIKAKKLFDDSPYAFNPLNGGYWKVLAVTGSIVQVVRFKDEFFEAVNESVTGVSADVEFFSSSGVQIGDKVKISDTLSVVSHRTYSIVDVNPQYIDIVSSYPLPEETDVPYVSTSVVIYMEAKKLLYLESDQEVVVRINGDLTNNLVIVPVVVGDSLAPGYFHMWGEIYKLELLNKSVNSANILCIKGE